jgi:hypothetical protein
LKHPHILVAEGRLDVLYDPLIVEISEKGPLFLTIEGGLSIWPM